MPVPDFFLHEICDQHDFNYWIGCTWKDRLKADNQLYTAARKLAGWNPIKQAIALTYYIAVRAGGAFCFHYADRERDEADLAKILEPLYIVVQERPEHSIYYGQ